MQIVIGIAGAGQGPFVLEAPAAAVLKAALGVLPSAAPAHDEDRNWWLLLNTVIQALQGVVEPDVVVAARSAYSDRDLPVAPLLAVEVLSASSAWLDKGRKLSLYEEHGVASYWIVDPAGPSITVLELEDGCYVQTGSAYGDESVEIRKPFVVNINPAVLNAG